METPKYFTAGQAAKAVGVTTPTISKALKSGKLSYIERTENGYKIDPAELFRVFPPVAKKEDGNTDALGSETPKETPETVEMRISHAKLAAERDALQAMVDELRQDRDEWRKQAQTLLLTDATREEARPGLFARLFSGGKR